MGDPFDVCVVGGCGRAGLPLAIVFAKAGLRVVAYDIDKRRVAMVREGHMPFMEAGADAALTAALASGGLSATTERSALPQSKNVIVVIGTPVDEFLNPSTTEFRRSITDLAADLRPGALLVLRSTVYPGTTEWVERHLRERGLDVDVVFCPERIAEGNALDELPTLPQIIGADTERARDRAHQLFQRLVPTLVDATTKEAEVAKLLTNTWRYMKFAVANHFFMISHAAGLDYARILNAVKFQYPRAADLPGPGFAAGPCLLKDTLQLAAFTENNFMLGQAAMVVNEGLPAYVVNHIGRRMELVSRPVGILGMAFKPDSDDSRASLSYKLKRLFVQAGARVLCTDPFVEDPQLAPLERVLAESELIVIGVPHTVYRGLDLSGHEVVDVWDSIAPSNDFLAGR